MAIQVRVIDGMGSVTETSPGVFATTGMMTADHMGVANDFVGRAGVLKMSTDFIVAQRLAGANMSVDVSVGTAYVLNSSWSANSNTHTRYWSVINDATVNAVIGANASGNPRIDIVTLKVDTAATPDGNASNVGSIYVTAGTPAASPVAPATPSNHLLLANVAVSNGAVSIVTANITDKRVSVYLDTNPTASGLADLGMSRQAIMNGNFDIWQRGTSTTPADVTSTYLADRWVDYIDKNGGTLPTLTRSRQLLTSGDIANAFYFTRLATNGAGTSLGVSSNHLLMHKIENGTRNLCGASKTVTVSYWARSSITNKRISVTLYQNYGSGGSPSSQEAILGTPVTLTSSWVKYTTTLTTNTLVGKTFGTGLDDVLVVGFHLMWGTTLGNTNVQASVTAETYVGSGNIDIAQVQLCSGDVALPFQPKSFGQELQDCQRYYEPSWDYGETNTTFSKYSYQNMGMTYNGGNCLSGPFYFKVQKRTVSPTITVYDVARTVNKVTWADGNGSSSNGTTEPSKTITDKHWQYSSGGIGATAKGILSLAYEVSNEL